MSQRITIRIESTPSQALADVESGERLQMECCYLVRDDETHGEAGRRAGKMIARMLRQTSRQRED